MYQAEYGDYVAIRHELLKREAVDIIHMRGRDETVSINDRRIRTSLWNPLLFAIYYEPSLQVVKVFFECLPRANFKVLLANPEETFTKNGCPVISPRSEVFGLEISIHNKNEAIFSYIWSQMKWRVGLLEVVISLLAKLWPQMLAKWLDLEESKLAFNLLKSRQQQDFVDQVLKELDRLPDFKINILRAISKSPYCLGFVLLGVSHTSDHDI